MTVQKILVPVIPAQMPRAILRQAAFLARLRRAEIVLLHVVPSDPETPKESGAHLVAQAQDDLGRTFWPELDGLVVSKLVRLGDPARQILQAAQEQRADLIMLALDARWRSGSGWRGSRVFQRFLLRSVAARVIEEAVCPVWAIRDDAPAQDLRICRVLCFLDLNANSAVCLSQAADIAAATDALLFLFHAVSRTEVWVPGGSRFADMLKKIFTSNAAKEIAELQSQAGTHADVLIESGAGPQMLIAALERIQADLLVVGHFTPRNPSEDYADIHVILRNASVPVLISKGSAGAEAVWTGAETISHISRRRRTLIVLVTLALVIALGLGLLEAAFYTSLHPTGLCSSNQPNCDMTLRPGEAGRGK